MKVKSNVGDPSQMSQLTIILGSIVKTVPHHTNKRYTSMWKRIDDLEIDSITQRNLTHDEKKSHISISEKSTNLEKHQWISAPKINYN